MTKHCGFTSDGSCWARVPNCWANCQNDGAVSTPLQSQESPPSAPESDLQGLGATSTGVKSSDGLLGAGCDSVHKAETVTREELKARSPYVTRGEDGMLEMHWPEGLETTEIQRVVLAQLVWEINDLRSQTKRSPLPPPPPTVTTAEMRPPPPPQPSTPNPGVPEKRPNYLRSQES